MKIFSLFLFVQKEQDIIFIPTDSHFVLKFENLNFLF
jgi:hypothetical protein